jgi:hypothetical protein
MVMADLLVFMAAVIYHIGPPLALLPSHLFLFCTLHPLHLRLHGVRDYECNKSFLEVRCDNSRLIVTMTLEAKRNLHLKALIAPSIVIVRQSPSQTE